MQQKTAEQVARMLSDSRRITIAAAGTLDL